MDGWMHNKKKTISKDKLTLAHPVFISVISGWTAGAAETRWGQNIRRRTGSTGERTVPTALLTGRVTFWRIQAQVNKIDDQTISTVSMKAR